MAGAPENLNDLLAHLPIGDIAAKFGVDRATAANAVTAALPALLGGMADNTKKAGGEDALAAALDDHRTEGGLPGVDAVDVEDGKKIVRHVLGEKENDVARGLSAGGLLSGDGLLATLAPIVMAYLANKKGASGSSTSGGGGIGDILGGLLGGGPGGGGGGLGGGLGDVLGGALGGLLGGDDEPPTKPTSGTSRGRVSRTKRSTTKSQKSGKQQSGGLLGTLGGLLGKIFRK